jgi:hypothetical protein
MKDGFVIYTKYEEQIKMLTDTQAGILLRAMIAHQKGEPLPKMDGLTAMAFTFIRQQNDEDGKRYEEICRINKENGMKGGRPRKTLINKGEEPKKPNGYLENRTVIEKTERFLEETTSPKKKEAKKNIPLVQEDTPLYPPKGSGAQEKFFKVYCQFKKFAKGEYPHIDFNKLLEEFDKSASLRKTFSWQLILDSYNSILAGNFRDKVDAQAEGREAMANRERYYAALRNESEGKAEAIVKKLMTFPRYAEIDKRLRMIEVEAAKADVKGEKLKAAKLEQERNRLKAERNNILSANGLEEDDIIPKRRCYECNDTGWLEDGTMCACYKGD